MADTEGPARQEIAVIGTGISGLSAAWLLAKRHNVTVYESAPRPGGHSNTVDAQGIPVDTGFIVYNEATYPNLSALFAHLGVATIASDMSFAVSMDDGRLEYAGTDLGGLFAQKRNLASPAFWSMLRDLTRFYRDAERDVAGLPDEMTVGEYLDLRGYGLAFQRDHLLPMAAAIWSGSALQLRDYPVHCFVRFCANHGLLKFRDRPVWRTVAGGSRSYVRAMMADLAPGARLGCAATGVRRFAEGVMVRDITGQTRTFDHVVLATHADQALALLDDPDDDEGALLGCFQYSANRAVLHSDPSLMPRRRRVWCSWNYLGLRDDGETACVTYWMNRLQGIPDSTPMFVTLNPMREPRADLVHHTEHYEHPQFDMATTAAQEQLWRLQGGRRTWFCGAWFGAGFHEDGLQSGLAVAEQLGGVRRPWQVADESGRIHVHPARTPAMASA